MNKRGQDNIHQEFVNFKILYKGKSLKKLAVLIYPSPEIYSFINVSLLLTNLSGVILNKGTRISFFLFLLSPLGNLCIVCSVLCIIKLEKPLIIIFTMRLSVKFILFRASVLT